MSDLEDIIENATNDLQDWMSENPGSDPHDYISELADVSTPIYNYDILKMGLDNLDLANTVPEVGPAFDGQPTAINILAAVIYERIEQALYDYAREHENDYLDEEEAEEE